MNIEAKVKDIVANSLDLKPEEVMPESNLVNDFDMDSLDSVELIMALEEEFDIEIPDEDADNLLTVKDIVEYIIKKTMKKG